MTGSSAATVVVVAINLWLAPQAARRDAPEPQRVTLVATDYAFTPSVLHAVVGQPLEITIVNRGQQIHGLRLTLSYGTVPFPENVPPGRSISATFDDLGTPGTYRFYCPVDEHDPRGMHGTLVVEPSKR